MSSRLPVESSIGVKQPAQKAGTAKAVSSAAAKPPVRKASAPKSVSSRGTPATESTAAKAPARKASPVKSGVSTGPPAAITAAKPPAQHASSTKFAPPSGRPKQAPARGSTPALPSKAPAKPLGATPSNNASAKDAQKTSAVAQRKPSSQGATSTSTSGVRLGSVAKNKTSIGKPATARTAPISAKALTGAQSSTAKGAPAVGARQNVIGSPPLQKKPAPAAMVDVAPTESQIASDRDQTESHIAPDIPQAVEATPDQPRVAPQAPLAAEPERESLTPEVPDSTLDATLDAKAAQVEEGPEPTHATTPEQASSANETSQSTRGGEALRFAVDVEVVSCPSRDKQSVQFAADDEVMCFQNNQARDSHFSDDSTPTPQTGVSDDAETISLWSRPKSVDESIVHPVLADAKISGEDAPSPTSRERKMSDDLVPAYPLKQEAAKEAAPPGPLEGDATWELAPTPNAIGSPAEALLDDEKPSGNSRTSEDKTTEFPHQVQYGTQQSVSDRPPGTDSSPLYATQGSDTSDIVHEQSNPQGPHGKRRVTIEVSRFSDQSSDHHSDISTSSPANNGSPAKRRSTLRRVTIEVPRRSNESFDRHSDISTSSPANNNSPVKRRSTLRRVTIDVQNCGDSSHPSPAPGRASITPNSSPENKPPPRPSRRVTIEVHRDELSPISGRFSDGSAQLSDESGSIAPLQRPSERRFTVEIQGAGNATRVSPSLASSRGDQWRTTRDVSRRATICTAGSDVNDDDDDDMEGRLDRLMKSTAQLLDQMGEASMSREPSVNLVHELVDKAILQEANPLQRKKPSPWLDLCGIEPGSPLAQRRALQANKTAQSMVLGKTKPSVHGSTSSKSRESVMSERTKKKIRRSLMQPAALDFQQQRELESSVNAAFSKFDHDIHELETFGPADSPDEDDYDGRSNGASTSTSLSRSLVVERLRNRLTEALDDLEGDWQPKKSELAVADEEVLLKADQEISELKKAKEESDHQLLFWKSKYESMLAQATLDSNASASAPATGPTTDAVGQSTAAGPARDASEDANAGAERDSTVKRESRQSIVLPSRASATTSESMKGAKFMPSPIKQNKSPSPGGDSRGTDLAWVSPRPSKVSSSRRSRVSESDRPGDARPLKDWSGLRPLLEAWKEKHGGTVKENSMKVKSSRPFEVKSSTSLKQNLRNWTTQYEKMRKDIPPSE
eukprot:GEMP01004086.1.p1 GENE.GEMP01004086.1~~GEMP01004086.1.p1  ORF type:complete len:1190 (+),score=315.01 GEMP01004086.1:124-3693(+)